MCSAVDNDVVCILCFQTGLRVSVDSQSLSEQAQWDKECESCREDREGENTPSRGAKDKRKYGDDTLYLATSLQINELGHIQYMLSSNCKSGMCVSLCLN